MGINSDEQLARQLQQQEFERSTSRYSRTTGVPVVVGVPLGSNLQPAQVYQGQPMGNLYASPVVPEVQIPPEFEYVPRLAIYVKFLALLDVLYLGLYLLIGIPILVILLPLPILGYLGAVRYNSSYLIWYIAYQVIITSLRVYAFVAMTFDTFLFVIQIISIVSSVLALLSTFKLYSAIRELNTRSVGPNYNNQ